MKKILPGLFLFAFTACAHADEDDAISLYIQSARITKEINYYYGCSGFDKEYELKTMVRGLKEILKLSSWYELNPQASPK